MPKNLLLCCLLTSGLGVLACSSSSDKSGTSGNGGGTASGTGDAGMSGAASVDNPDPINLDCPATDVGPLDGPFAQKGACCYRTSNKARIDNAASAFTLEYRLNYFMLINHLKTIDPAVIGPTTIEMLDNEEQSVLFRFVLPEKDGKVTAGKGHVRVGPGRYNCDGTYSFYSEKAVPTDSGAADRWYVPEVELDVKPDETDQRLVTAPFKTSLPVQNRPSYLPYLNGAPEYALDWEAATQGFTIIQMPLTSDDYDCVGSRTSAGKWTPAGKSISYGRLDLNDGEKIDLLSITFCQLMAFGASPDAPDCQATPRCMPGKGDCKWLRLPDSLCPVTDEEKASWGCHLGYGGNPDNDPVKLNCSNDPPKDIDPDNGTVEGQCCDPLASADSGLPACNAWLQISDFTAAAVEITDKPSDHLQASCHGK